MKTKKSKSKSKNSYSLSFQKKGSMRLEREELEDFVGEPYLSRGRAYFNDGLVLLLEVSESSARAMVCGSDIYETKLFLDEDMLDGDCDCRAFEEFGPCKHLAATGFAVLAEEMGQYKPSKECRERIRELEKFVEFLNSKTKSQLVAVIMKLMREHHDLLEATMGYEQDPY